MNKIKEYGGWITSIVSICALVVTVMWYGKKIDSMESELIEIHETSKQASDWRVKVGTIIEIQTGIKVNP